MEKCSALEQNVPFASCEEMRDFVSIMGREDYIVCPMPRRVGISLQNYPRPLRCNVIRARESSNLEAGAELLDLILTKEDYEADSHDASGIALASPFFSGSPPSRVGNPLTQDAKFRDEGTNPIPAVSGALPLAPHPPFLSAHRGLTMPVRAKPAGAVRIEGFDIHGRESRNPHTPAHNRVEGFNILSRDRPNPGRSTAIRVEGFDIMGRDRRNSSVSAAA